MGLTVGSKIGANAYYDQSCVKTVSLLCNRGAVDFWSRCACVSKKKGGQRTNFK
jgi:hypothetical protein